MDQKLLELAGLILNCKPDDLRGSSLRADGSLAVIAPNGMKFVFSPVELENARDSFGLPPFQSDLPAAPGHSSQAKPVEAALDRLGQHDRLGQRMNIKPVGPQAPGKTRRHEVAQ